MSATRHLGLTWDHPRGYNALAAAARDVASAGLIQWDKQPLEGFETAPIGELAARYDMLIIDHPHVGEAVAADCLVPLEDVFGAEEIAAWGAASVGPTLASYRWQDRHWALPLDVATQVMAYRPDLIGTAPGSWNDVLALSERAPVALSVAGPHAALNFQSMCVALGEIPGGEDFIGDATAREALDILRRLFSRAPASTDQLNPIGLLNAMASGDTIACVPLVFGYNNYARPQASARGVAFADAPTGTSGARGSVLGGTGLALTRRARPDPALLDHFRWLMSPATQRGFIPEHDGQPSARQAWTDPAVNAAAGDFYRATLATTEAAWVRARHDGAVAFQTAAAHLVRGYLQGATLPDMLAALRQAWRQSRPPMHEAEQ